MADTQEVSPVTLLDGLAGLDPQARRELATTLRRCLPPSMRCLTARRPHTCSASWLTCSTRPDQRVDLYRIWSVPGQASVPSTPLCFPTTCRPESMSR